MIPKLPVLALLMAAASFQSADLAGASTAAVDRSVETKAVTAASSSSVWEKRGDCGWWLNGDNGKSHRASISQGDTLLMSISDPAFVRWAADERQLVDLIFDGNSKRQVQVEGWSTQGSDGSGTFGFYLDEVTRRYLSRADKLSLRRHGRVLLDLQLANSPTKAELDACAPPNRKRHSDDE